MNPNTEKLYRAAIAADAKFQAALERAYGSGAGDMRYNPSRDTRWVHEARIDAGFAMAAYRKAVAK